MNTEQERTSLIHVAYLFMILSMLYIFFRYVIYMIMPFLLGFLIAFSLRPAIRHTLRIFHLSSKFISFLYLLIFYGTIGIALTLLCIQCFHFLKDFMIKLPDIYELQIAPALYSLLLRIQRLCADFDPAILTFIQNSILKFSDSLQSFALSLSSGLITIISSMAASVPNIIVSFFITILSSLFFTLDFTNISHFIIRQFSSDKRSFIYVLRTIFTDTIQSYIFAYGKMMLITFVELSIGLSYLKVDGAISIAFLIAFFDILPILGTGTIIFPWVIISFFNHQQKFAVGLLIIHLVINVIRQIIEPKIVGKQMGLHPLLMLACMFFGVKLFGFLGIFLAPILLQIVQRMNEEGLIHLYK